MGTTGYRCFSKQALRLRLKNTAASASKKYISGATEYRCFSKQAFVLGYRIMLLQQASNISQVLQNTDASASKLYVLGQRILRILLLQLASNTSQVLQNTDASASKHYDLRSLDTSTVPTSTEFRYFSTLAYLFGTTGFQCLFCLHRY